MLSNPLNPAASSSALLPADSSTSAAPSSFLVQSNQSFLNGSNSTTMFGGASSFPTASLSFMEASLVPSVIPAVSTATAIPSNPASLIHHAHYHHQHSSLLDPTLTSFLSNGNINGELVSVLTNVASSVQFDVHNALSGTGSSGVTGATASLGVNGGAAAHATSHLLQSLPTSSANLLLPAPNKSTHSNTNVATFATATGNALPGLQYGDNSFLVTPDNSVVSSLAATLLASTGGAVAGIDGGNTNDLHHHQQQQQQQQQQAALALHPFHPTPPITATNGIATVTDILELPSSTVIAPLEPSHSRQNSLRGSGSGSGSGSGRGRRPTTPKTRSASVSGVPSAAIGPLSALGASAAIATSTSSTDQKDHRFLKRAVTQQGSRLRRTTVAEHNIASGEFTSAAALISSALGTSGNTSGIGAQFPQSSPLMMSVSQIPTNQLHHHLNNSSFTGTDFLTSTYLANAAATGATQFGISTPGSSLGLSPQFNDFSLASSGSLIMNSSPRSNRNSLHTDSVVRASSGVFASPTMGSARRSLAISASRRSSLNPSSVVGINSGPPTGVHNDVTLTAAMGADSTSGVAFGNGLQAASSSYNLASSLPNPSLLDLVNSAAGAGTEHLSGLGLSGIPVAERFSHSSMMQTPSMNNMDSTIPAQRLQPFDVTDYRNGAPNGIAVSDFTQQDQWQQQQQLPQVQPLPPLIAQLNQESEQSKPAPRRRGRPPRPKKVVDVDPTTVFTSRRSRAGSAAANNKKKAAASTAVASANVDSVAAKMTRSQKQLYNRTEHNRNEQQRRALLVEYNTTFERLLPAPIITRVEITKETVQRAQRPNRGGGNTKKGPHKLMIMERSVEMCHRLFDLAKDQAVRIAKMQAYIDICHERSGSMNELATNGTDGCSSMLAMHRMGMLDDVDEGNHRVDLDQVASEFRNEYTSQSSGEQRANWLRNELHMPMPSVVAYEEMCMDPLDYEIEAAKKRGVDIPSEIEDLFRGRAYGGNSYRANGSMSGSGPSDMGRDQEDDGDDDDDEEEEEDFEMDGTDTGAAEAKHGDNYIDF